ncbi:MAG: hypothetical protein ACRC9O_05880 [Plesiomonas sp.]|uniref:hypothetical protein n=1 Tax=Plesiomonas sp. TaxID=2486279 RepID=UPI003F2BE963
MKILIYGEFSGYGKSLAAGFRQLGHEAAVFSPNGDGWKKLGSEFYLSAKTKVGKLSELIKLIPVFLSFDVVYIMNPSFFDFKLLGPLILFLFKIKKIKVYLLCCGDDVEYIKAGESGVIEKFVFSGVNYPVKNYFKTRKERIVNYLCVSVADKIIPTMYDYQVPWKTSRFTNKVTDVIPLACHIDNVPEIKPTDVDNIKIMHGINRRDVKGTNVILAALKRIDDEFDNVTIYTPEKLSQTEYLKLFSEVDISIDQCKCHSYGMNTIYAMLHGHVVLAPADEMHCRSFKITNTPIVSISNDEEDIYQKLKHLIISAESLDTLKRNSIDYAVKYHKPERVCKGLLTILCEGRV